MYKLDNWKLEGIYNGQMIFSNLVKTENGFKFNMTTIPHELIYNLDGSYAKKYKSIDRLYALYFYNSLKTYDGGCSMWNT